MHYDTKVKHPAVQPGDMVLLQPVVDPGGGGGGQGVRLHPSLPPPPRFRKPYENEKQLVSVRPNYFIFRDI